MSSSDDGEFCDSVTNKAHSPRSARSLARTTHTVKHLHSQHSHSQRSHSQRSHSQRSHSQRSHSTNSTNAQSNQLTTSHLQAMAIAGAGKSTSGWKKTHKHKRSYITQNISSRAHKLVSSALKPASSRIVDDNSRRSEATSYTPGSSFLRRCLFDENEEGRHKTSVTHIIANERDALANNPPSPAHIPSLPANNPPSSANNPSPPVNNLPPLTAHNLPPPPANNLPPLPAHDHPPLPANNPPPPANNSPPSAKKSPPSPVNNSPSSTKHPPSPDNNAATARGGEASADTSSGRASTYASGGRASAYASGDRVRVQASGGQASADSGRASTYASGGRASAYVSGGRVRVQASGGQASADSGRASAYASGGQASADASGGRARVQASGGNARAEDSAVNTSVADAVANGFPEPRSWERVPPGCGLDYHVTHRSILGDPLVPGSLSLKGCAFCLLGYERGTGQGLTSHHCNVCLKAVHAFCQDNGGVEGSGSTGPCYYCRPGPMDVIAHDNRLRFGGLKHTPAHLTTTNRLRAKHGITILSPYSGAAGSVGIQLEPSSPRLDLDLDIDDEIRNGGVPDFDTGGYDDEDAETNRPDPEAEWNALWARVPRIDPPERSLHVQVKFNRGNNTKSFGSRDKEGSGDQVLMTLTEMFDIPHLERQILKLANRAINEWRLQPTSKKSATGGVKGGLKVNGSHEFTLPFTGTPDMHKRAVISCKEFSEQKQDDQNPIWVEDSTGNDDLSVKKRLLASFNKVTKNYAKGAANSRSRETFMQIWVTFRKTDGRESVRGNTRQYGKLAQRINGQLRDEGMGADREIERVTLAIKYSRQKAVKISDANSASGPIDLGDAPTTDDIMQSRALDALCKRIRAGKRLRDADCATRESTFREHCHPLTLLKKVKLADGTMGEEIIEALAMPMQLFTAVGMPYMMYRGFVPRRPNFVEEVEGAAGVAALGTTVNDPTNILHLSKDRAKEELQSLAWDTQTRPYPQLMESYVSILRGQRVAPRDGDEVEPHGEFAARTGPEAAGNRVFDEEHTERDNLGQGF